MIPPEIIQQSALQRLEQLGGAPFVCEMIDLFLKHVPRRMEEAQAGWNARDLDAVMRATHSIKSSAGNLGAEWLRGICSQLELLARDQQPDDVALLMPELLDSFEKTCEKLTQEKDQRK